MYYFTPQSKGRYFQPARFDKYTPAHLGLAFLAMMLTKVLCMAFVIWLTPQARIPDWLIDPLSMISMTSVWFIGLAYDLGQATGYRSEEGIDPLDLAANTIGVFLGAYIFWWW